MPPHIRHVILDRDGVLNTEAPDGGCIRDWREWAWLPGTLESLRRLRSAGVLISVATNQACVGRGIVTRGQLDTLHARMCQEAAGAGGAIGHLFVCPHAPAAGCDCRKPAPGLLLQALAATGVAPQATLMIGDDLRDLEAAAAARIPAALVRTGKGTRNEAALRDASVPVFDDLSACTAALLSNSIKYTETGTCR